MTDWRNTEFGKLYQRLMNAHANAWRADAEFDFTDNYVAEKRAHRLWDKFRKVEKEFHAALDRLLKAAGKP